MNSTVLEINLKFLIKCINMGNILFLTFPPSDISVEPEFGILGSTVTLTCTIKSDRPERVDWTKDQNVIADSNAISDYR